MCEAYQTAATNESVLNPRLLDYIHPRRIARIDRFSSRPALPVGCVRANLFRALRASELNVLRSSFHSHIFDSAKMHSAFSPGRSFESKILRNSGMAAFS